MKRKVFIGASIIFIIDQLSKLLVINFLTEGKPLVIINNLFNFTYVKNTGAAFSLFTGNRAFLIITSLIALLFIIMWFNEELKTGMVKGSYYLLLFGGIFGNLFDRIIRGYVVDFIDIKIFNYDFAIFNISDMAIVLGASLIIFSTIRGEINDNNKNR